MQQYTIGIKIFLTFFAFGFILWLGGSILRTAIAFDLFVPGTELVLKKAIIQMPYRCIRYIFIRCFLFILVLDLA